jgi:fructose-specific phosphotransferase system IIC component
MQLGYAYQLLLSSVFLGNIVVGMLNPEVVRVAHKAYRPSWLVIHIVLAVLTMLLVVFHLYVVYGYS